MNLLIVLYASHCRKTHCNKEIGPKQKQRKAHKKTVVEEDVKLIKEFMRDIRKELRNTRGEIKELKDE